MRFDDLDQKMRVYETAADQCVLPGLFMVARLDGRSFTRLTKELVPFEAPFDERFRDLMIGTIQALMNCGFRVLYAYTQSDEISLLLGPEEQVFRRKLRKYNSVLAGEASAQFSIQLGRPAVFDCRISQLPSLELVVDYFRWRSEDAVRNALNAWCYWTLRKKGLDEQESNSRLLGLSISKKNELLFQLGINFNDVPTWQKRGIGLIWEEVEEPAVDRLSGEAIAARRQRIRVIEDLPMRDEYTRFVEETVLQALKQEVS